MLHASTRKLIDRLSEMTELGKLDWTNGEDGNICYATEGYSVSLTEDPNEVVITSKDGKELERATADEITATEREDGTTYTAIVAAMTSEASRIARGAEAAISSLLAGMEDAPADEFVDAEIDGTESLQEDLGDDTTVMTADAFETVEQESPVEETNSDASPEEDVDETELVASEDETSMDIDAEDTQDADTTSTEMDAADDAEDVTSEDEEEHEADAGILVASTDEDLSQAASEAVSEAPAMEETQTEEIATPETESEPDTDPELQPVAEMSAPEAQEVESESDVSEAVARMADEVKNREDTGLETAAASAVGAVALAAGLTPQDSESEEPLTAEATTSDDAPIEETDEDVTEIVADEAAAPPAYVPFGLNETEQDLAEAPEVETAPELVADAEEFVEATVETNIEPEIEDIESPMQTLEQMADDTFATRTDSETVEDSPFMLNTEPADSDEIESPTFDSQSDSDVDVVVAETEAPESADTASSTFTSFVAVADSETDSEPELAATSAAPEPEAPAEQSYSLSGIGAGFGLGALSAKTEASGIPGPRADSVETGEKVIIDATDDVLPKLEGNLNVSLAETASAAVSNANAGTETNAPEEDSAESDSDILKPRTRFNPWD